MTVGESGSRTHPIRRPRTLRQRKLRPRRIEEPRTALRLTVSEQRLIPVGTLTTPTIPGYPALPDDGSLTQPFLLYHWVLNPNPPPPHLFFSNNANNSALDRQDSRSIARLIQQRVLLLRTDSRREELSCIIFPPNPLFLESQSATNMNRHTSIIRVIIAEFIEAIINKYYV